MLLTNGRFYTMDTAGTVVDTLVVRDGRVAFAGRRGDVNVPDAEETRDLGGRAVLPGLVDGHAHLNGLARGSMQLRANGVRSEEEIARMVGEAAARGTVGEWVAGRGWDQNGWPGARFPIRHTLDRAAPDTPAALTRIDGHATWASTAALRAAGITRDTPDPVGGLIVKDDAGEPTGLLIDTAQGLVTRVMPRPSPERFDRAVREAIDQCLAVGLTGLHEMGVDLHALDAYKRLIARGAFPFRNYAAVAGRSREAWEQYRARGPEEAGDGRLVVRAIKLVADGALGSRGAALHEDYSDDPGNRGLILIPPEELLATVGEARAAGFQVCVHAIGDRANTLVLDTFEQVLAERPLSDHRWRVEHAQTLTPADIPRFARLGVLPSMQATHCTSDIGWAVERLGPERLRGAYAWRSLLDTGVVIPGGSDFPVEEPNPFLGIDASVLRRPFDGSAPPPEDRDQRMTRDEAVRSFTVWNAYASHQERDLGTLETGKRADLVVLDDDVFTCPEERIAAIRPLLTMVGGEVVYEAVGSRQ